MANEKSENVEVKEHEDESASEESYVSDQLAVKTWSVIARFLHEGAGILVLEKAWDSRHDSFLLVPWYAEGQPEAIRPDVWMAWRHELKAPLGGHAFIRDYAEVVDRLPLRSERALERVLTEQSLMLPEARRRFREGEPGLVALALRVYHLPRAYKLYDVASYEGEGELVPLPFDVELNDLTPAVEDGDFDRRLEAVRSALRRA